MCIRDSVSRAFDFGKQERVKTDLSPHLEATFNKCIKIKTLINPATQSDFLSIYSTQRFSFRQNKFDQYEAVELIKNSVQRIIITGTGGAGKVCSCVTSGCHFLWTAEDAYLSS